MFFRIYFSRKKFEKDAATIANKKGWSTGACCSAKIIRDDERYISPMEAKQSIWQSNGQYAIQHMAEIQSDLKRAREELFALDTWDKNRKSSIDSKLRKVRDFLGNLLWKPMKERD